jgi:hypothetical protein
MRLVHIEKGESVKSLLEIKFQEEMSSYVRVTVGLS